MRQLPTVVRTSSRAWWATALLCAVTCWTRPSRADDALSLNWVRAIGAESCVASKALDQQLRAALASDGVAPAPLVIEGLVTHDSEQRRYHVQLRVLDAAEQPVGVRELISEADDCQQLTPSIVLVLSLMVELGSRTAQPLAAKTPPVASTPAPVAAVDAERPPALRPAEPTAALPARWRVEPSAALALAFGLNPDTSAGPRLALRVRTPWWLAFAVHAGYWPGGRTRIASEGANVASVDFHTFQTGLDLCLPLSPAQGRWYAASCWGASVLLRKVHPIGLDGAPDSLRVSAGASASLQLGYTVHDRWSLSLEASLQGYRRRDRYAYADLQGERHEVFRPGHLASVLSLGLGAQL